MKNKYLFGIAIIIVFLGVMIYLFTQTKIEYETDFKVIKSKGKVIKATGSWIKEKSFKIDNTSNTFTFFMKDVNNDEMKVIYKGSIPNNFETATSIVVTGKYSNGCFYATDVLTKCPSKYEGKPRIKTSSS